MKPETLRLAERTAAAILSGLENTRPLPARIVLAKYETQHDYETLRPEDKPALLKDHTALIEAIETKLATHLHMAGIRIETPVLNAAAYLRWLHANHLKNNDPANRARFISNPPTTQSKP